MRTLARHPARFCRSLLAALLVVASAGAVSAAEVVKEKKAEAEPEDTATATDEPRFIRLVSERGQHLSLEIAARRYTHPDGSAPDVDLVGAVHIGDPSYYAQIQAHLDDFDVVLYESVKPPGTGGSRGTTDAERVASTEAALGFLKHTVEEFYLSRNAFPESLDELAEFAVERDPRYRDFLDAVSVDGWDHPVALVRTEDPLPEVALTSLGADGAPGGTGAEADLTVHVRQGAVVPRAPEGDALQAQLASALDLAFQLDAIDYGRPNFRCSDMAMDEVEASLRARGSDFSVLEGTLAGSSLPAQLVKVMLGLIRFADTMMDGAVSDMFKILLVEMLSDETQVQGMLQEFDPGLAEVIIGERNEVVAADVASLMTTEPPVETVGVFYGAGHMEDLADRLAELGYEEGDATWFRAIEIDVANSAVTEREVVQMRLMMRRMMHQMRRAQQR